VASDGVVLQWSRANDGAETSAPAPNAADGNRFNGAAPMMARKQETEDRHIAEFRAASMEPRQ